MSKNSKQNNSKQPNILWPSEPERPKKTGNSEQDRIAMQKYEKELAEYNETVFALADFGADAGLLEEPIEKHSDKRVVPMPVHRIESKVAEMYLPTGHKTRL